MDFLTTSSLLDALVLATLAEADTYGYALTQAIIKHVKLSETALYPALKRLQKSGCLEVYDKEINGRNRRYYRILDIGRKKLAEYQKIWRQTKSAIDTLLGGESRK